MAASTIGMTVAAIPSSAPPGQPALGAPGALGAPATGGPAAASAPTTVQLTLANQTALYIPLSDGRFIRIPFKNDDQAARHSALHHQILGRGNCPPGTTINLSEGTLERNGMPVECTADIKDLIFQMQKLVDEVMDRTWSETSWPITIGHDRAPINYPPSFQQFAHGKRLGQLIFSHAEAQAAKAGKTVPETQIIEAHAACRKALRDGIPDIFDQIEGQLRRHKTLQSQGRSQQLAKTKDHYEKQRKVIAQFAAYYPLELTGLTPPQINTALDAQKARALAYLQRASGETKKSLTNFRAEDQTLLDGLATEMALISCKTQYEYRLGCLHFGVERTQTSPEIFFIRLASMIRADTPIQQINDYLELHIKIGFPELNHPEDRETMKQGLLQIARDLTTGPNRLPGIGL